MSVVQDWYESRSMGSHICHAMFAPLQPANPYFYIHMYESLEDDSTAEYVFGELVYASGWLFAASVHAFRTGAHLSPFKIMTDGLSISRYILADAGLLTPALGAAAVVAGGIAVKELVGSPIHYQSDHDRIARARSQASARERPAWANLR